MILKPFNSGVGLLNRGRSARRWSFSISRLTMLQWPVWISPPRFQLTCLLYFLLYVSVSRLTLGKRHAATSAQPFSSPPSVFFVHQLFLVCLLFYLS
jgi:hypothetical protein